MLYERGEKMKRINWREGSGMTLMMMSVWLIILTAFCVVVEIGGKYVCAAAVQTKTDAIIEGASVAADTGIINSYDIDIVTNSYKDKTELSGRDAKEMADRIYDANKQVMPGLVTNYTYNSNALGPCNGLPQLSYNQRLFTAVGRVEGRNIFNLLPRPTYRVDGLGTVYIIGTETPLEDTVRFSDMYPNDPRIPISALTSNTGTTLLNAYQYVPGTSLWESYKGQKLDNIADNRSAALYDAVLDQFGLGELQTARYVESEYAQYDIHQFADDYVYGGRGNAVSLTASDTLLWDISVAMGCELPRYTLNTGASSNGSTYYDWNKGHKGVELGRININDTSRFGTLGAVSEAVEMANKGCITFAVGSDGTYYFIRPTVTDGSDSSAGFSGTAPVCAYTNGTTGSGRKSVNISGCRLYYVKATQ